MSAIARQPVGRKSPFKTAEEMDRIRKQHAEFLEKNPPKVAAEPNEVKELAYFSIGRYVKGSFRGLFVVYQLILEDEHGKPLKKPIKKALCEGVDIHIAQTTIETAIRKRVFA